MSDELDVVAELLEAVAKMTPAQRKNALRELRQQAKEAAPGPGPKWGVTSLSVDFPDEFRLTLNEHSPKGTKAEMEQAARILNTLERDGAVLLVRDWQEAPDDDTLVLRWMGNKWGWSKGWKVLCDRSPWAAMPAGPGEVEG